MTTPFDRRAFGGLLAVVAGAAMLAGCGKGDSPEKAGSTTAAPAASAKPRADAPGKGGSRDSVDPDRQYSAKLNAYTAGYNRLIGSFGLMDRQRRYLDEHIPRRKATDSLSVSDGWIHLALDDLKKARGMSAAGLDELDKSGDALIAQLDPLVTQLKALEAYYNTKAYKDDNLARGKAEDAQVVARFDGSVKAMRDFDNVLSREAKKRDAVELARMKAAGDTLGYNTKLALGQADQIVAMFSGEADVRSADKYKAADAVVVELEKTLADQRKAYAAAKDQKPSPDSGHDSTVSRLETFLGQYRELKQSKQARDFNSMMKKYNDAVEAANSIRR